MTNGESVVTGGPEAARTVPRSRRFASDWADLVLIPIFLGLLGGTLLGYVPEKIRSVLLVVINVGWLLFRDTVFAPGRRLIVRRVVNIVGTVLSFLAIPVAIPVAISLKSSPVPIVFFLVALGSVSLVVAVFDRSGQNENLKLISNSGAKVTLGQAFIRNTFLMIPYVLFSGYVCEIARTFFSGLVWRRVTYVSMFVVILALGLPAAISLKQVPLIVGMVGALVTPAVFLIFDRDVSFTGNRLMDVFSKTRITTI